MTNYKMEGKITIHIKNNKKIYCEVSLIGRFVNI